MGAGPPAKRTDFLFSPSNLRFLDFARAGFLGSFWPVPPRPSVSRNAWLAAIFLLRWSSYSDSGGGSALLFFWEASSWSQPWGELSVDF